MLVILFDESDNIARWRDLDPRDSLVVAALLGPDDPDGSVPSTEGRLDSMRDDLFAGGRFTRGTDAWKVWSIARAIVSATASAAARCRSDAARDAGRADAVAEPCGCRSDAA